MPASVPSSSPAPRLPFGLTYLAAIVLFFGPPALSSAQQLSLHEAVQQALRGPLAQAVGSHIDEARGAVRQAGLGPNPRLFLTSEDLRPGADRFDFGTQTEDYAYVSQTFELDGKRRKRSLLAQARLEQTRAEADRARQEIAGRTAAAYWNALALNRTATLLREDMQAVEDMVRYHRERVAAGAMRGVDLLRFQIERDRIAIAVAAAERDAEQARLELYKQMGQAPVANVSFADKLEDLRPVETVSVEMALAARSEIRSARDASAAAAADVRLQRSNGVPDLDLLGGYKRNSADNTGFGGLQIPLTFRNRNQGEIERANASVTFARANLTAIEVQVRAEIEQAEANYRRSREIVTSVLPGMRSEARENLRVMTEAYRVGGVDLLRYLDAVRTEFEVEVSAMRLQAEAQQAAVRLQLSYGEQP